MSSPYVPFGVSVSEVYLAAKKFQRWMKDRRWKEIQESMKRGRKNPSLSGFLKHVYGTNHELLTWGESIIPCCVFRAPRGQISKPDSILSKKLESEAENLEEVTQRMGQTYLDLLLNTPAKPWNGKTYRMIDLQSQKRLRMRVAVGSYYNALRSCDILQFEILEQSNFASGTLNQQTYETFGERLGLRKRIARMSDDIITNGAGRSVAIGGETLIIFKVEGGRYNSLFGERSSDRVAANPDLVDVLPSFMFQPVVDDFVNEYSLTHNIFREYLEEVFNLDEVKHPRGHVTYRYFYRDPNLLYLKQLLKEGKAELLLTGVSVDLFNLRPDICTLLLIKDSRWFKNHSEGKTVHGWKLEAIDYVDEFKTIDEMHAAGKTGNNIVELPKDLDIRGESKLRSIDFHPSGAAALLLGLEVAKVRLGIS